MSAEVDETVEAGDRVLTPGLISTHAHIAGSPLDRSFIEDTGRPQFYYSGLFETLPVRDGAQDEEASRACVDFSDGRAPPRRRDDRARDRRSWASTSSSAPRHFGLRVYFGLSFRSGRWLTKDGRRVHWEWDEARGRQGSTPGHRPPRASRRRPRRSRPLPASPRPRSTRARQSSCARPSTPPTSAACPITLHASQSVVEFTRDAGAPRQDADRLARRAGLPRAAHDPRPRDHRRRLVVDQSPGRRRPDHGRRRLLGRPCRSGSSPAAASRWSPSPATGRPA